MITTQADTTVTEVITKSAPPVGVSAAWFSGLPIDKFVLWATAIYTVAQLFFLLRDKWWRQRAGYKGVKSVD